MSHAAIDIETLSDRFRRSFGTDPGLAVLAPGRVNLIGEHVDYAGLPVLPMAIDRRITLLARARPDATVRITSTLDRSIQEFPIERTIPPEPGGAWGNYPRAAAQALAHHADLGLGMDALVASDLPVAAGLSSSSALVVAVGLALMEINRLSIDRLELAQLLASGERYVGTQGGGMDQAASLMARHGHAARIDFGPLAATHIPIPDDWCFIVADTLERAEKSGAAQPAYNARTRDVEAARARVAGALRIGDAPWRELIGSHEPGQLLATARSVLEPTLFRRFRHLVTEANRVAAAEAALRRADLVAFGGVLGDGHASLREDYEVSTDRLDHLTTLAVEAGATGARLTGAGLGGCALAVCPTGRAPDVLDALERGFYAPLETSTPADERLFTVEPSAGATVIRL